MVRSGFQERYRAPDTRGPSSVVQTSAVRPAASAGVTGRHRRGAPAPRVHGSAPTLVPVLASAWAVTRKGQTPTPTAAGHGWERASPKTRAPKAARHRARGGEDVQGCPIQG